MRDDEETTPVHRVTLYLCDPCLDGEGDECHTPGCALFLSRAPDIPIRWKTVEFHETPGEPRCPCGGLGLVSSEHGGAVACGCGATPRHAPTADGCLACALPFSSPHVDGARADDYQFPEGSHG